MFIRWFAPDTCCSDEPAEVEEVLLLLFGDLLVPLSGSGFTPSASEDVWVAVAVVVVVVVVVAIFEVELFAVFGAAARAPGDDTDDDDDDDVVGLDCAGLTRFLMLPLMHCLPNALLLLILLLFVLELFKFFADDVAAANSDEWGSVPTFVDPIGPPAVDEIRVSYSSFISLILLAGGFESAPPPTPSTAPPLSRRFFSAGHSSNPFGLWRGVSGADRLCDSLPSLFRSSSLFDFTLGLPAVDAAPSSVWL